MADKHKAPVQTTQEPYEEFAKLFEGDPQDLDVVQDVSDAFAQNLREILGKRYVPRASEVEKTEKSEGDCEN